MSHRVPYRLIDFFQRHSTRGDALALITVLDTEGSTYSKAGGQMLVAQNGNFEGMLSGGCLENDLGERAKTVMRENQPAKVSYDLSQDDGVFGLGVGCEGAIHVLIQPLSASTQYEPFASLVARLSAAPFVDFPVSDNEGVANSTRLWAPVRLLILGAGMDAEPLVVFAVELGYQVSLLDHRPASVAGFRPVPGVSPVCAPANSIASHFELDRFDAVIVMSHNLDADRAYLKILADSSVPYIGLLGPPHRRDRLLREIGDRADRLGDRLHGPVGRQLGGRGPGAIALEIVAELQARFSGID